MKARLIIVIGMTALINCCFLRGYAQFNDSAIIDICANRYFHDYINPSINHEPFFQKERSYFDIRVEQRYNELVVNSFTVYSCRVIASHTTSYFYCVKRRIGEVINGTNIRSFNEIINTNAGLSLQQKAVLHYLITFHNARMYPAINKDVYVDSLLYSSYLAGFSSKELNQFFYKTKRNKIVFRVRRYNRSLDAFEFCYIQYRFKKGQLKSYYVKN
jgi:hypothetical protein